MPRTGKKGKGGARSGTPGKAYAQRTDLNADRAPTPNIPSQPRGLPHGEASRREASQRSLPLPRATDPATLPSLSGPSQRPNEPVTAGLGIGAGPGPEATVMGGASPNSSVLDFLQMLFNEFPTPELQQYIELAQQAAAPNTVPADASFRPRTLPASDYDTPFRPVSLIPNQVYRNGGRPHLTKDQIADVKGQVEPVMESADAPIGDAASYNDPALTNRQDTP